MPETTVNNKTISEWTFNTKDISEAYMNTKLIFNKSLELSLPQFTTEINIKAYLDSIGLGSNKNVVITNNLIQPRITTGDLTGLNVTLINKGEIQGTRSNKHALSVTSPLLLKNEGSIKGAGGNGGKGGQGGNDTYVRNDDSTHYAWVTCNQSDTQNYWVGLFTDALGRQWSYFSFGGKTVDVSNHAANWTSIPGLPGQYRRTGGVVKSAQCSYPTQFYRIERRIQTTVARPGGIGGAGGIGQAFEGPATPGTNGAMSIPPGGYNGGRGGNGGVWGTYGEKGGSNGGPAGANGTPPGSAIIGSSNLHVDSITGTVVGAIVQSL